MCRSCADGGRRCPSASGKSRREYQNARNARIRAKKSMEERFGETPPPAELEDVRRQYMDVGEFLADATPQEVVQRFADTALIWDVPDEHLAAISAMAREAIPEAGARAAEAYKVDLLGGRQAILAFPSPYREELYEAKAGLREVSRERMRELDRLQFDYVLEHRDEQTEFSHAWEGRTYEADVRNLGTCLAVAAVADYVAEVDNRDLASRVENKYAEILDSDPRHVKDERKFLAVSGEIIADLRKQGDDGRTFREIMDWITDEVRKRDGGAFSWTLARHLAAESPAPEGYDVPEHIRPDRLSGQQAIDTAVLGIERMVQMFSERDAQHREGARTHAERIVRTEVNEGLLASYRSAISSECELAEPSDWVPKTAFATQKVRDMKSSFAEALSIFPASFVNMTREELPDLTLFYKKGSRGYFAQSGTFFTRGDKQHLFPLSALDDTYAALGEATEKAGFGEYRLNDEKFFIDDTPENRERVQGLIDAYHEAITDPEGDARLRSLRLNMGDKKFRRSKAAANRKGTVHLVEAVTEDGAKKIGIVTDEAFGKRQVAQNGPHILLSERNGEEGAMTALAAHEFGHAVEHTNMKVEKAMSQFLYRRTADCETQDYEYGDPGEVVAPDGFTNQYIGKMYDTPGSTEVFTMAMESLFHGRHCFTRKVSRFMDEPVGTDDSEHRDLVLGTLLMSKFDPD